MIGILDCYEAMTRSTISNQKSAINSIEIRATQIKPAQRTLQLAPALPQFR
jgi:hypothetical protein